MTTMSPRARWLALLVLCLGDLMIVLDVTIVGVALPSIRSDLGFSEESLVGRQRVPDHVRRLSLLGGRLGDLFGHRRLFLLESRLHARLGGCGLATSQEMLVGARRCRGSAARRFPPSPSR